MQREWTLELRHSIREIGLGLRRPEELVTRWRDRQPGQLGQPAAAPHPLIFPVLLLNAVAGIAAYGLIMQLHIGAGAMLASAFKATLAAGAAWTLALPALYIINSALGSRLDLSTTVLAALATVSFGAMAMLASVPITWFFSLALPYAPVRLLVNVVVFAGVGVAMTDVFIRALKALEPERSAVYGYVWVALVGWLGCQLFFLLGVFRF